MYYVNFRIGYLVSQYPATNHTFILREIRGLRAAGADVAVCSVRAADRASDAMTPEEQEEAAATFYLRPVSFATVLRTHLGVVFARPRKYFTGLAYAWRIAGPNLTRLIYHSAYFAQAVLVGSWMERRQISHLHTHFSSTVALLVSRVFPITWSATLHGPDEFSDPTGFHLAAKCESASHLCAISDFGRSELMRLSRPEDYLKFEVARLGVDPNVFQPRPFRERTHPWQLLSVGRLAPVKAQHILVAAVDILTKRGREVRLHLVGGGASRAALESEVSLRGLRGRVLFEGSLNQDRVRKLYRQTDIFTLASFAEGIPVVLMEAMAMEIPCVSTSVNGIPELIRDGVDGLLVAPADAEAMADAIERLIDDTGLRRRLGEAGRRRVLAEYNLEPNVEALAKIFERRLLRAEPY